MFTFKHLAQILSIDISRDMHIKEIVEGIGVCFGQHNSGCRFIIKMWHDHDQNKWRVWSPYAVNAEFHFVSDALFKVKTLSHELGSGPINIGDFQGA